MLNARGDKVAVTGCVEICFSIDGKFDLAFDYGALLSTMRVREEFHILKESEEDHEAIVRPNHRCLHDILGERHVNTRKRFDEIWK